MTPEGNATSHEYDVVVIGGGAAGLTAALVLARARRRVAVVDAGAPRNAPAAHMHGFLGSDGMPPADLLSAGRSEVAGYGGHVLQGRVDDVVPARGSSPRLWFHVRLEDGRTLRTRRVLITTGLRDEIPDVPGAHERWGRDLLHCPYCHGWEVRDQPLGVLGGTPEAIAHAQLVREWSADVVLFSNGAILTVDEREQLVARGIGIVDEPVTRLSIEDDRLVGVEIESGRVVPRAAVFVRPDFVPHDDLLLRLGCATHDNGWVAVDVTGGTSVPGIWAAGNAVNPRAQVVTAAGEGSAAAIAINNDLVVEDVAVAISAGGPPARPGVVG
ncbi:thioredoxin reductase [Nocardioides szechwanensis]|uniref:Thioredoxin reductase n=1 Tax=Nocardioides szechwanensis TaxID=1005944 RepID=A0A1H0J4T6_9ACTN|nr:NAD(P)/FAD-dependent oxidoreductase [Nocardioides szechwanensis]GEP35004.1 thioredoxin reductase [Nocardioides szechwanensis]SDO38523.1 Thioredoxin reductase [Nocardioides szechwanensis]